MTITRHLKFTREAWTLFERPDYAGQVRSITYHMPVSPFYTSIWSKRALPAEARSGLISIVDQLPTAGGQKRTLVRCGAEEVRRFRRLNGRWVADGAHYHSSRTLHLLRLIRVHDIERATAFSSAGYHHIHLTFRS